MKIHVFLLVLFSVATNGTMIRFVKYKLNSTKCASVENAFKNLDDGNVLVNSTVEFFQDVLKEVHSVTVKASKNDMDFNYELTLLRTKVDSCRVAEGVLNSIFMKVMMENFWNSSDYDFKCPFKKGVFKMIDMKITSNHLPPFPRVMIPSGRAAIYIKDDLFGKIKNIKKMVHLYTWELFVKVYDDNVVQSM